MSKRKKPKKLKKKKCKECGSAYYYTNKDGTTVCRRCGFRGKR